MRACPLQVGFRGITSLPVGLVVGCFLTDTPHVGKPAEICQVLTGTYIPLVHCKGFTRLVTPSLAKSWPPMHCLTPRLIVQFTPLYSYLCRYGVGTVLPPVFRQVHSTAPASWSDQTTNAGWAAIFSDRGCYGLTHSPPAQEAHRATQRGYYTGVVTQNQPRAPETNSKFPSPHHPITLALAFPPRP